jgi:hypothetical protein
MKHIKLADLINLQLLTEQALDPENVKALNDDLNTNYPSAGTQITSAWEDLVESTTILGIRPWWWLAAIPLLWFGSKPAAAGISRGLAIANRRRQKLQQIVIQIGEGKYPDNLDLLDVEIEKYLRRAEIFQSSDGLGGHMKRTVSPSPHLYGPEVRALAKKIKELISETKKAAKTAKSNPEFIKNVVRETIDLERQLVRTGMKLSDKLDFEKRTIEMASKLSSNKAAAEEMVQATARAAGYVPQTFAEYWSQYGARFKGTPAETVLRTYKAYYSKWAGEMPQEIWARAVKEFWQTLPGDKSTGAWLGFWKQFGSLR